MSRVVARREQQIISLPFVWTGFRPSIGGATAKFDAALEVALRVDAKQQAFKQNPPVATYNERTDSYLAQEWDDDDDEHFYRRNQFHATLTMIMIIIIIMSYC